MEKLHILWVNDNPTTAHNMVFMYGINALVQGWFDDVEIIIWGASTELVAKDKSIQDKIKEAIDSGVSVVACLACAKNVGAVEILESLSVDVKYMGVPLTQILKNNEKLITI